MKVIQISRLDNVAVALHPIKKGERSLQAASQSTALEDIPQGHKIALNRSKTVRISSNKYGFAIRSRDKRTQKAGAWMHTHNVKTNLEGGVGHATPSLDFGKNEPETLWASAERRPRGDPQ